MNSRHGLWRFQTSHRNENWANQKLGCCRNYPEIFWKISRWVWQKNCMFFVFHVFAYEYTYLWVLSWLSKKGWFLNKNCLTHAGVAFFVRPNSFFSKTCWTIQKFLQGYRPTAKVWHFWVQEILKGRKISSLLHSYSHN